MNILLWSLIASVVSLAYGLFLAWRVLRKSAGNDEMQSVARAIQKGASAYLKRQDMTILGVGIVIGIVLYFLIGKVTAIGFVIGAVASALAGYIGMMIAVRANVRVAEEARNGLNPAFRVAHKGGAVTGFLVVGLALLSVTAFYWITADIKALVGLGFGASLISVFARLGGGIFSKGADIGADMVGKIEAGIPEDDVRNPAVIADNVGDNVCDCAGMAADLFETYVVSVISVMLLTHLLLANLPGLLLLPLLIGAVAVVASVIGSLAIFLRGTNIMAALYRGLAVAALVSAGSFWVIVKKLPAIQELGKDADMAIFWCLLIGVGVAIAIVVSTEFCTSKKFYPVKAIARASVAGHSTNIITGLAISMQATALPVIAIVAGMLGAYHFAGIYGVGLATMSMLSLAGIIVAMDAFGPITDNAGGIARMAGLPNEVRGVTDSFDAVGNTTKAVTKGYAIASAGLAALILFAAYTQELVDVGNPIQFPLTNVRVLVGLLLGGLMPYLFGSMVMQAVSRAGSAIVEEVRRQFRDIAGIMDRMAQPDYVVAVDIATKTALHGMILPALVPIAFPIAVGFLIGPEALGGLLIGMILTGLFVAISMTSGGGAWDNAKKYIEEGEHGGKGSRAYEAAVTGDTVGDSYKDVAGPAINPMIKVATLVAFLIARFL